MMSRELRSNETNDFELVTARGSEQCARCFTHVSDQDAYQEGTFRRIYCQSAQVFNCSRIREQRCLFGRNAFRNNSTALITHRAWDKPQLESGCLRAAVEMEAGGK